MSNSISLVIFLAGVVTTIAVKVFILENKIERLHHSIVDVQSDLNTLTKEINKNRFDYDKAI
jgi:hypothetical protein